MSVTKKLVKNRKYDTVNDEGRPSYSIDDKHMLVNMALLGTLDSTFYKSEDENKTMLFDTINKWTEEDVDFLIKTAIYAKEVGGKRTSPIALMVKASTLDFDKFKTNYSRVIKTPKDWSQFMDLARSKSLGRVGIGSGIKKLMISDIAGYNDYLALKYSGEIREMIRMARPKESINPSVIPYIMRRETVNKKGEVNQYFNNLELYKKGKISFAEFSKERVYPYELVSSFGTSPEIWEYLMNTSPIFNFLRNLRNYFANVDADKVLERMEKVFTKEAIKHSKIFPAQLYIAYKENVKDWDIEKPPLKFYRFKDIMTNAIKASLENIAIPFEGRVAVLGDISGSMTSTLTSSHSDINAAMVVGLVTASIMEKNDVIFLPFDSGIRVGGISAMANATDFLSRVSTVENMVGGGTNLAVGFEYLTTFNNKVDNIIGITDNESWFGNDVENAIKTYIKKINPNVKIWLMTIVPNDTQMTKSSNPNITYLYGWNDDIFSLSKSKTVDEQIKEIEAIKWIV
jgi:hypothetical protein